MKKVLYTIAGVLVAAAVLAPMLHAETSVDQSTIPVTADVTGVNNVYAEIRQMTDDALASAVAFGTVPPFTAPYSVLPQHYVYISSVADNSAWQLRTYTNNFTSQPSTITWGEQYGGLIGATPGHKVSLGWVVEVATQPVGYTPATQTPGESLGWTYLKDLYDVHWDTNTLTHVSDYPEARPYQNIAFGGPDFTTIVNRGMMLALPTATSPFKFYLEGNFASAPPDSYSTSVYLDLMNQ